MLPYHRRTHHRKLFKAAGLPIVLSPPLFLFLCVPLLAAEIHVSPSGSDEQSGSLQAPVLTLEKARELARSARKANPNEPVTIWLHPGLYMIRQKIDFTANDSGTPAAPFTIAAWPDPENPQSRPHLVGGTVLSDWKHSDFSGRSDVWEADLGKAGITETFRQLFLDGVRQTWARYPNVDPGLPYSGGWAYVAGKRLPMYNDIEGEPTDTVVLREKDARKWTHPTDGEVCIFPRYNWWNRIEKIKQYDPATRTITLERSMPYAARPMDRFAVFGMREELDAPGEWFQDVENRKLYFIPPGELAGRTVTVPTTDYVLQFTGTNHVIVRGIEFSCAARGAVRLADCENAVLEQSLVHDLGYFSGAGVSLHRGKKVAVRGCNIWNIGGHGVEVYAGDSQQMEQCEHLVDNCYIHHIGQFNRHGIGVMLSGCGVTVSHNLIHDTPRCGIFHGGVLHTLEYNRIRHCNTEMEDTGCTYGGGWTGGWTVIRYNHCSDSVGFNNHGQFHVFAWGIYLDESCCGCDVYGNVVERAQVGAMHLHNARENHIFNNVFANNAGPNGTTRQLSLQGWNDSPTGVFRSARQDRLVKQYNARIENPAWKEMRGMEVTPEDPYLPDGTIMHGNRIERNIFYYPEQPDSTYVRATNCNFESNTIDYNVVWNGGGEPIKTGRKSFKPTGPDVTELIPNHDFSEKASAEVIAKDGNQTAATGWSWYHKTFPEMASEIVTTEGQGRGFAMGAAYNPELKYIKYSCIRSKPFPLTPGKDYLFSFNVRSVDTDGSMTARIVSENKGLWKAFGQETFKSKDGETTACQTFFHFPAAGEADYDERLGPVTIQFQFQAETGQAVLSDLSLAEVTVATEWEAWQMDGADRHSIVADPSFVDGTHGDFRLKPDSPALKLGFEPIPLESIGPYSDNARATWPIQEAEGVREHPEWLTSVDMEE